MNHLTGLTKSPYWPLGLEQNMWDRQQAGQCVFIRCLLTFSSIVNRLAEISTFDQPFEVNGTGGIVSFGCPFMGSLYSPKLATHKIMVYCWRVST